MDKKDDRQCVIELIYTTRKFSDMNEPLFDDKIWTTAVEWEFVFSYCKKLINKSEWIKKHPHSVGIETGVEHGKHFACTFI